MPITLTPTSRSFRLMWDIKSKTPFLRQQGISQEEIDAVTNRHHLQRLLDKAEDNMYKNITKPKPR
jgi:hypothetical protein